MKDQLTILKDMRHHWKADRPVIEANNGSKYTTLKYLTDEVNETLEAFENGQEDEIVCRELADVGWHLIDAFQLFGGDIFEDMREKMALNIIRYQAWLFQDGTYEEKRAVVKHPCYELPKIGEFYTYRQAQ